MRQINYCVKLLDYIGFRDEEIEIYIETLFSDIDDEEIKKLDIYDLNNIILSEINSNINYFLESGHSTEFESEERL